MSGITSAPEIRHPHDQDQQQSEKHTLKFIGGFRLSQLEASLEAARQGKIETLVQYATVLATEGPLLLALKDQVSAIAKSGQVDARVDLDALAEEFDADLTERPASTFVEGDGQLRDRLAAMEAAILGALETYRAAAQTAVSPSLELIGQWRKVHDDWQRTHDQRREELERQGLKVQVGELERITGRITKVRSELARIRQREVEHREARRERERLLKKLGAERERIHMRRRATLRKIVDVANQFAVGLTIEVTFEHQGVRGHWARWLTSKFGFRLPRVRRLAETVTPQDLATLMLKRGKNGLLSIKAGNDNFFAGPPIERFEEVFNWSTIFELQTMRLEDRPRIRVRERDSSDAHDFDHLSTGQQRSVLLSLMLCAERLDPLILDQPEDHLDAGYIASAVVRHLEHAKERRQVILATHSPNLTVLGEAELVVPMYAAGNRGAPRDEGAVDRPETRRHVCDLLEGGEDAYRRRGERYGLRMVPVE